MSNFQPQKIPKLSTCAFITSLTNFTVYTKISIRVSSILANNKVKVLVDLPESFKFFDFQLKQDHKPPGLPI